MTAEKMQVSGLVGIDKASISFLKSNMQCILSEKRGIGNINPRWHNKIMHYNQPNVRLNLHFCRMEMEKCSKRTGSWKHDQASYHGHHICVAVPRAEPLFKWLWAHSQKKIKLLK